MTTEITNPGALTNSTTDKLVRDLKGIAGKADYLLKDASHTVAEDISIARHAIAQKACTAASATHDYVRGNPWKIVGLAAAAGVFIGALISRR